MTSSTQGWLCISCGHIESPLRPSPTLPVVATVALDHLPAAPNHPAAAPSHPAVAPDFPKVLTSLPAAALATTQPVIALVAPGRLKKRRVALWLALAVLMCGLTIGAYLWLFEPHVALAGYLQRLASIRTARLASSTSIVGQAGYTATVTASGVADISSQSMPKFDLATSVAVKATSGLLPGLGITNLSLDGQLRLVADNLYLKLTDWKVNGTSALAPAPTTWYKLSLSKAAATASATANAAAGATTGATVQSCLADSSGAKAANIIGRNTTLTRLPVAGGQFLGFSSADGAPALHYSGTISPADLETLLTAANQSLRADCRTDVPSHSLDALRIRYELWRGWSSDKLTLTVADAKSQMQAVWAMTTGGYNQLVGIAAPTDATDLSNFLSEFQP